MVRRPPRSNRTDPRFPYTPRFRSDRRYDVLVATNIVESGLDIPSANTLVVYRADLFGLAQMYQLRGRVGRSKLRAYSYFTYQAGRLLSTSAEQRLRVLQSLDTLGAGFTLASHDLRLEEHTSELQSLMRNSYAVFC